MKAGWLIGAALLFSLAGAAFYFRAGTTMTSADNCASSEPISRAELEKRARVRLPGGIRDLEASVASGGIDDAVYLRFEVPTEQLATLLANAGLAQPLSETERYLGNYTGKHLPWWQPDSVAPFQSGNLIRDQERPRYAISLLASRNDSPWQTVYLFVSDL